ncbi:MAG: hypothetical protein AB7E24_17565 [Novosphingobium sp.]
MRMALILAALLALSACAEEPDQPTEPPSPNDWLLSAKDDDARFELLQKQLRGFDQPMWEVGERFERLHAALMRGNPALAAYHWEKIKTAIENGIAKRPKRAANAKALFLDPVWAEVDVALKSGDPAKSWAAFERAKAACMACHVAEKVEFMNDQPVFDLAPPAGRRCG